jgi:hypothetical protein
VPAGIAADRFDRRMILIVTDVARGLLMLVIAAAVLSVRRCWSSSAWPSLATCFATFFSPAIGAFLPTLVRDESELGPANSAWASLDNLAFFVGPAFAALLLALGGLEVAFLINALTFGVVAVVLWGLPRGAQGRGRGTGRRRPTSAGSQRAEPASAPRCQPHRAAAGRAGRDQRHRRLRLRRPRRDDRHPGRRRLGAGEAGTGLLNSAIGVGGLVGALLAGVLVLRRRLGPPLLAGSLSSGPRIAASARSRQHALALVAIAVGSAGALLVEIVGTTLFQRIVPDECAAGRWASWRRLSVIAYAAGAFVMPVVGAPIRRRCCRVGRGDGRRRRVGVLLLGRYAIVESTDRR